MKSAWWYPVYILVGEVGIWYGLKAAWLIVQWRYRDRD